MAFEPSDCPFSKVVAMIVGVGKLVMKLFGFNECDEFLGNFVDNSLKCWNNSCLFLLVVAKGVAGDEMVDLASFDGCCKDGIAVIIVENEDVAVAWAGNERESVWEVGAY